MLSQVGRLARTSSTSYKERLSEAKKKFIESQEKAIFGDLLSRSSRHKSRRKRETVTDANNIWSSSSSGESKSGKTSESSGAKEASEAQSWSDSGSSASGDSFSSSSTVLSASKFQRAVEAGAESEPDAEIEAPARAEAEAEAKALEVVAPEQVEQYEEGLDSSDGSSDDEEW
jgi:hypothetical protein